MIETMWNKMVSRGLSLQLIVVLQLIVGGVSDGVGDRDDYSDTL